MSLPLTKTMHPDDLVDLAPELVLVDKHFTSAREQHPARRWEYAMALRAINDWFTRQNFRDFAIADVGGDGSPFLRMIETPFPGTDQRLIDPAAPDGVSLKDYLTTVDRGLSDPTYCGPYLYPVVTCMSVLEHVEDLDQFLYHLSCLVAPGGLLFLTMDCCGKDGPDTAHFHWDRKRIFGPHAWRALHVDDAFSNHFSLFGGADWAYHGDQLYGSYSFASLALVKR